MRASWRVVVDTNVIVSGLLFKGLGLRLVLAEVSKSHLQLMSTELAEEVVGVLARSKFDRIAIVSTRQAAWTAFTEGAEWVPVTTQVCLCRDPIDDHILALAIDGQANYVVTGDQDLLILGQVEQCSIVSPADFLRLTNEIS